MEMYHKTVYIALTFMRLIMVEEKEIANGYKQCSMYWLLRDNGHSGSIRKISWLLLLGSCGTQILWKSQVPPYTLHCPKTRSILISGTSSSELCMVASYGGPSLFLLLEWSSIYLHSIWCHKLYGWLCW